MKSPKGFRGKYFSLAAILALSTTVTLANDVKSVVDTKKEATTEVEYSQSEELTPKAEELEVVVISKKIKTKKSKVYSASKNYVSATNVTDNVSIITSQEMKLQGMTTLIQALESLPGISFTNNGGLGQLTSLYIQGFSNKYTLVLIDGVRYNDPFNTSGSDLSNIMLENVDRIEVIKGSQSGVWGADAAAGVVNIIMKKAKSGTHASISAEAGSYKYKSLSTSLSHRTRSFDIILSAIRITQDGFTAVAPKGENLDQYENDPYRNTTLNLKTGYWIDTNNKVEFGYHDINSFTNYDDFHFSGTPLPDAVKRSDYRGKSSYLKYKHFSGKHKLEATLAKSSFQNKQLDATYGVNNSVGETPSFELKDTFVYGKDNALVFGGFYEQSDIEYTQVFAPIETQDETNKALFINNTYRYENIVLSQALRYDSFSAFDSKVTGKIGGKYLITDTFNIYANFGNAYKAPNIMDMINIWGDSNFDLKPEQIQSFNVGVQFEGLNINVFKNQIKDMIVWNNAVWPTPGKNVNIEGTSTLKGIEISYEEVVLDKLLLGGNYTYIDAKDKDGNRLLNRPRYQVGLNATYSLLKDLTISANGTYIGSRKDYTGNDTGRYFLANANVNYNINKTWSTYLKINNLLDKEYQTVYNYATARRSLYLGIKANF